MTNAEIAKKLLEFYAGDASKWTQGQSACNAAGRGIDTQSDDAVCWCLFGAAHRLGIRYFTGWPQFRAAFGRCAVSWNDAPGRTFAEVEAKLKEIAGGES